MGFVCPSIQWNIYSSNHSLICCWCYIFLPENCANTSSAQFLMAQSLSSPYTSPPCVQLVHFTVPRRSAASRREGWGRGDMSNSSSSRSRWMGFFSPTQAVIVVVVAISDVLNCSALQLCLAKVISKWNYKVYFLRLRESFPQLHTLLPSRVFIVSGNLVPFLLFGCGRYFQMVWG